MLALNLDAAFALSGQLALAGWASLILLPRWRGLSQILAGLIIPAALSLGYVVLMATGWHGAKGGFSSLNDVAALFESRSLLLAGWVHYLAFDLFLGSWMLRRSQQAAIPHLAMVPILVLTFLFGPAGYLAYLLLAASVRAVREDRIARLQAPMPGWLRAVAFEPRLAVAGLAMLALAVPTALAYAVDTRQFLDANIWLKPLKFELSIALYLLTLAIGLPLTSRAFARSWAGRFTVWPVITLLYLELAYIAWRASRVEASHYNRDDWLGMALYSAMGIAAILFTLAAGIVAYGLARRDAEPIAPVLRWSLVLGLGLTCVLGLLTGGLLGTSAGHFVGTAPAVHPTVPLFGWSLAIGDLRVAHFLGLHALHFVPAFGLLSWLLVRRAQAGTAAVLAFSAVYAGLTLTALAAALNGRPLLGLG